MSRGIDGQSWVVGSLGVTYKEHQYYNAASEAFQVMNVPYGQKGNDEKKQTNSRIPTDPKPDMLIWVLLICAGPQQEPYVFITNQPYVTSQ